jgi:hypothetical protein
MGALSGENNALAGANLTLAGGLENISDTMGDVSTLGAQNALDESGAQEALTGTIVESATTTFEQLQAASGSGFYSASGAFGGDSAGLQVYGEITFGMEGSIGGGNSQVFVTDGGPYIDATSVGSSGGIPFTGSGPATFNWNETSASGGIFDITITLSNHAEVIAEKAVVNVTYTNPGGLSGSTLPASGSGTATATLELLPI